MEISLEEVGGKFLKKLPEARSIIEGGLGDAFAKATGHLWRKAGDNAPTSNGTLAKSITRELTPTYAKIYPQEKYGFWVHQGTRPHAIPKVELLPGGTLYRWAQKKGLNVYQVANAIRKKGTKANPWLEKTAGSEWDRVQQIFAEGLELTVSKLV